MNAYEACLRARAAWERTQSQMTLWPDVGLEEVPIAADGGSAPAPPRARHGSSLPPATGLGLSTGSNTVPGHVASAASTPGRLDGSAP